LSLLAIEQVVKIRGSVPTMMMMMVTTRFTLRQHMSEYIN